MSRREQSRVDRELFKDFGDFDSSSDEEEEQIRSHMRELAEIHRQEVRMRRDTMSVNRFPPSAVLSSIPSNSTAQSDNYKSQKVKLAEAAYGPEWKGLVKEIIIVNAEDSKKEQETDRTNPPNRYDSDADESSDDDVYVYDDDEDDDDDDDDDSDDTQRNKTPEPQRGMRSYSTCVWSERFGWFNLPRSPKK